MCAMLGPQHMRADWKTACMESLFLSTVGVPGLNSSPQAGQQGPLLTEPSCQPKILTFLKTTTETGREAGKGRPAWGEVRLCQHYIHEQFEKTNTSQGVLKAQTRLAILFFHLHLLFQSCPPPFTPCIPPFAM